MRRREFIALLLATALWPKVISAEQASKGARTVGILHANPAGAAIIREKLRKLGWATASNIRIVAHNVTFNVDKSIGVVVKELVELKPDVIVGESLPVVSAILQETHTIPVVFVDVPDPVASGMVRSLAHPGGNATGFTFIDDEEVVSKWIGLLREIAPHLVRVALLFNQEEILASGSRIVSRFEAATLALGLEAVNMPVNDDDEVERAFAGLSDNAPSGVIAAPCLFISTYDALIRSLATRHRVPTIYPEPYSATAGGLISYGPDVGDLFGQTASYVDRILRGTKPADLPVQRPTRFELVINMKTAKALGLAVPPLLLATADEVIE